MEENLQSSLLGKIAAYTEILVKDPRSTIFVSLAETYRKMGMFDDARKIIDKGLQMHPDFSPAHIVLARVLCQQEDYPASVAAFEKALELDPESLAGLVGYARVRILLGEEEAARELLLRARQLSPADPVINKLLLSLPEETDAGAPVTDSISSAQDRDVEGNEEKGPALVSLTLAELYERQGLMDDALNLYRQLLSRNPDDLHLRRKIRDLEAEHDQQPSTDEIPVTDETDVVTQDSADSDEFIETERIVEDAPAETVESAVEESAPAETLIDSDLPSREQAVMATLNQWLDNIRQRRRDV